MIGLWRKANFRLLLPILLGGLIVGGAGQSRSQEPVIPNFWDLRARMERPDPDRLIALRFLTTDDFPPFNFIDRRGVLIGFNIDLARAVCKVLNAECAIQYRPFENLRDALIAGEGDAIIAGLAQEGAYGAALGFTQPYLKIPARFMVRAGTVFDPAAGPLEGEVAVTCDSAHKAYLARYFPQLDTICFASTSEALSALAESTVLAVFGDGLTLTQWLHTHALGKGGDICCELVGGPYIDDDHFGLGFAIALRPQDTALKSALDYALREVYRNGAYAELYLRYFPLGMY